MTKTGRAPTAPRRVLSNAMLLGFAALLAGCAADARTVADKGQATPRTPIVDESGYPKVEIGTRARYGVDASPRVVAAGREVPTGGGRYQVGKPYRIGGKWYFPKEDPNLDETGVASWYGRGFHGRLTANGEVYDMRDLSAAHTTMPIPSYARVTNLSNGKSIMVRVNNRGPFHENRIMDMSEKAAEMLGFKSNGIAKVRVQYVGRAKLAGSDERMLLSSYREGGRTDLAEDRTLIAGSQVASLPVPLANPRGSVQQVASLDTRAPVQPAAYALASGPAQRPAVTAAVAPLPPPLPAPATSSAAVIAKEMGSATGAPMPLLPASLGGTASGAGVMPKGDALALPAGWSLGAQPARTATPDAYAATRVSAAHQVLAAFDGGMGMKDVYVAVTR